MLDFKKENIDNFCQKNPKSFKNKIKNSIKNEISAKNARTASFLTLASVLSACNFGGSSDSVAPLNISAIKGPLSNALAFVDRDGDGVHDDGEEFAVTNATGSATITPNSSVSATDKLVITSITAGQTIGGTTYSTGTVDTNTGGAVADLVLKAPSNSTVVTPVTTLVAETGLSETAVKEVLGLPAEMDVLNFNPFADNLSEADKTVALAAEKVALKVYTTVSTIQSSAKSSGLDAAKAFATAIEAVGEVVKEQSAAGAKADLADSSIIDKVVTKTETVLTTKLQESGFDAAAVTAAVNANKAVLATAKAQIKTVNDAADAITSFDATELGAIAKLAVKSGEEAAAAVTAEKANPGAGAAKFTMKTAEAVATAKATAKAEVEEAKGEETTTTATSSGTSDTVNFKIAAGESVDWAIDVATPGTGSQDISYADSPNASYTVSGSTMTIDLGKSFEFATLKALLNKQADLKFKISLSQLPTKDDLTNTTTLTITEGADSTVSKGEGQIKLTGKYGYEATSTTSTNFIASQDNVSIVFTPRAGDSDVTITTKNAEDTFLVVNDGEANDGGGQAFLEVETTAFLSKAGNLGYVDLVNRFVKDPIVDNKMNFAIDTTDLGFYVGSTKVNKIQTVLSIGDNPTTGGVVSGSARTGTTITVSDIADLDGLGTVTHQWQRSTDDGANWSNISGANGKSYTLVATDADADLNGNLDDASQIRYTASYTDGQGKAYTGSNKFVSYLKDSNGTVVEVTANQSPDGSGGKFTMSGGTHVGATLEIGGTGITDADGTDNATILYHWEKSTNGGTKFDDLSGTAGTPSATNTSYTIAASEVGNKTTQFRAVATFTDDKGASEVVNHAGTANVAKPAIYLAEVGTSTTDRVEIGIFVDDEMLAATGTADHMSLKAWQVDMAPKENWSTYFDEIIGGYKDPITDALANTYFTTSGGSSDNNGRTSSDTFKATQKIGDTAKTFWNTGNQGVVKVSDLSGKATISPQGTATVKYNFSDTDNLSATQLSNYDPQIGSLFLNPKVALGSRIEFDVKASSVYSYFDTDKAGGAGQVSIETDLTTILLDPYVFSFVL